MQNDNLDIIAEHLGRMQAELMKRTGRRVVTRINVESEVGLCMGIIPGTTMVIYTPCGPLEVFCERMLDVEYRRHVQWSREYLGERVPVDTKEVRASFPKLTPFVGWNGEPLRFGCPPKKGY